MIHTSRAEVSGTIKPHIETPLTWANYISLFTFGSKSIHLDCK